MHIFKRRKILTLVGIAISLAVIVSVSSLIAYDKGKAVTVKEQRGSVSNLDFTIKPPSVDDLFYFTNLNRSQPLTLDERLNRSAQAKCEDMVAKNYWSHNAPDGTEPWVFIQKQVPHYQKAAENLAFNEGTDSEETVAAWMGSPGHRANIIDTKLRKVGFGICQSPSYSAANGGPATIIVQHFTD